MRLLGQDLTVLEGAGLGLVGVADRVVRGGLLAGHELPLAPGREAGAAHAAQAGVLDRRQDLVVRQLAAEQAAQHAVALVVRRVGIVREGPVGPHGGSPRRLSGTGGLHELLGLRKRGRLLVDGDGGCGVAAPQTRHLVQLDLHVIAVASAELGDPLVGGVQPAREVVADREVHLAPAARS